MPLSEALRTTANRWAAQAALLWGCIVLAICVRSYFFPMTHSVYPIFANAGANWLAGRDCYAAQNRNNMDLYRYSPTVSALFVPFSLLSDSAGGVLWRLLQTALFLAAFCWYLHAVWPQGALAPQALFWAWALLIPLSIESINNGQANVMVVASLLAATAAVSSERWNIAAGLLTVAFLFKLYPLALALLLCVASPRKLVWRFGVALTIGLGIPLLLQAPHYVIEQYVSWFNLLTGDDRRGWAMGAGYRDSYLLFRFFLVPPSYLCYLIIQLASAAALAFVAWQSARWHWPVRKRLHALFTLACCWMMLFGPATESCTFIFLAAPLACAIVEAFQSGGGRPRRTLLIIVLAMFVISFLHGKSTDLPLYILQPLAAFLLFLDCIGRTLELASKNVSNHRNCDFVIAKLELR